MSKPALYARDLDGTGSMHVCAQDDPGAIEFVAIDDETREAIDDALALLRVEAASRASWGESLSARGAERLVTVRKHITALERLRGTSG